MRRSIKRESHGMNAMPRVMRFKIFSLAFLFVSLSLCQGATHTVTVGDNACNGGFRVFESGGGFRNQLHHVVGGAPNCGFGLHTSPPHHTLRLVDVGHSW